MLVKIFLHLWQSGRLHRTHNPDGKTRRWFKSDQMQFINLVISIAKINFCKGEVLSNPRKILNSRKADLKVSLCCLASQTKQNNFFCEFGSGLLRTKFSYFTRNIKLKLTNFVSKCFFPYFFIGITRNCSFKKLCRFYKTKLISL